MRVVCAYCSWSANTVASAVLVCALICPHKSTTCARSGHKVPQAHRVIVSNIIDMPTRGRPDCVSCSLHTLHVCAKTTVIRAKEIWRVTFYNDTLKSDWRNSHRCVCIQLLLRLDCTLHLPLIVQSAIRCKKWMQMKLDQSDTHMQTQGDLLLMIISALVLF